MKPKKLNISKEFRSLIKDSVLSIESIDFTGDHKADFICRTIKNNSTKTGIEYWISSEYVVLKKIQFVHLDHYYCNWFINLDDDPEPEIFRMYGDQFTNNACFIDQCMETKEESILVYITPVILNKGKGYIGYPWNISNIKARQGEKKVELFYSFGLNEPIYDVAKKKPGLSANFGMPRVFQGQTSTKIEPDFDDEIAITRAEFYRPIVFFYGEPTPDAVNFERDKNWASIKDLIEQTKGIYELMTNSYRK